MSSLYSNVFRALPGLACVLNSSGTICDVNPKFERYFEVSKDEIISSKLEDLFAKISDRIAFQSVFNRLRTGEEQDLDDMDMRTNEGNMLRVRWTLSKLPEDHLVLVFGVLSQTSPRSTPTPSFAVEPVSTKTVHTVCASEVESIVNAAVAKERIEKLALLAAEKDRFIRVMFHEIRTPLHNLSNTFNGAVKMMKLPSSISDEMIYQIDACTGLVEDLSFATMFESDQVLHPRPVKMNLRKELESILQHVGVYHTMELSRFQVDIHRDIDFGIPEWISVDQALLRALNNLIKNAVKYCAPNGTVSVSMTFTESSESVVMLSPKSSSKGQVKSGTLSVSIKNSVSEAMDLVHINRMFQSCYANSTLFSEKMHTNPLTAADNGMSIKSVYSSDSHSGKESSSDTSSRTSSRAPSVSDSLMSSEGLGLGLYVAYNIISNLGGLLECSGSESESVFSFSVPVKGTRTSRDALRLTREGFVSPTSAASSAALAMNGGIGNGTSEVPLLLRGSSLSRKHWFHAIDSGEGSRHIITQGLSPARRKGAPLLDLTGRYKPRVLIVDDSPICRKVLVKALESNGYDTDTACDGKEACDKLDVVPCLYEAVLMDLRMPIMDGITATRVCKSKSHLSELPIIIVTAELGEEVRRECMEAKASHFISKPARVEELLDLLTTFIKK